MVRINGYRCFLLVCIVWALAPNNCYGQKDSTKGKHEPDSTFVRSYYHLLDLGLNFGSQYMEYRTFFNDTFSTALRPNEVYTLTPSINYRWLSVSYSFTPEFLDLNNDDSLRGSTSYRRLSTSLQFDQFNFGAMWSKTKGFYLSNMQDIFPAWKPGEAYLKFPEMEVKQFMFTANYRTNKNFSLKAISGGEEEQLKSAWTFLPGLHVTQFHFQIPDQTPGTGKTELTRNFDININLPVAGTWVFANHAYVSGIFGPILGIDFYKSVAYATTYSTETSDGTRISHGWFYGMNMGYNQPKWYIGANTSVNKYQHSQSSTERLSKEFFMINIYGGLRMNAPRLLKKPMDWTEKILPFLK